MVNTACGYSTYLISLLVNDQYASPPDGGDPAGKTFLLQKITPDESGLMNLIICSPSRPQPRISLTIFSI